MQRNSRQGFKSGLKKEKEKCTLLKKKRDQWTVVKKSKERASSKKGKVMLFGKKFLEILSCFGSENKTDMTFWLE